MDLGREDPAQAYVQMSYRPRLLLGTGRRGGWSPEGPRSCSVSARMQSVRSPEDFCAGPRWEVPLPPLSLDVTWRDHVGHAGSARPIPQSCSVSSLSCIRNEVPLQPEQGKTAQCVLAGVPAAQENRAGSEGQADPTQELV